MRPWHELAILQFKFWNIWELIDKDSKFMGFVLGEERCRVKVNFWIEFDAQFAKSMILRCKRLKKHKMNSKEDKYQCK